MLINTCYLNIFKFYRVVNFQFLNCCTRFILIGSTSVKLSLNMEIEVIEPQVIISFFFLYLDFIFAFDDV